MATLMSRSGSCNCGNVGRAGVPGYMSTIPMTRATSIKTAPVMPAMNVPGKTNNSNITKINPTTNTITQPAAESPAT